LQEFIMFRTLLTSAFLFALSMSAAQAADKKVYHGNSCDTQNSSMNRTPYGTTTTSTSASLTTTCDVINDIIDATGQTITGATVYYQDQTSTAEITCTLYARYELGASAYIDYNSASSGVAAYGSAVGSMSISAISESLPSMPYRYVMYCSIPPVKSGASSYVLGYSVTEG